MSGGIFEYRQHFLNEAVERIEEEIKDATKPKPPLRQVSGIVRCKKFGKNKNNSTGFVWDEFETIEEAYKILVAKPNVRILIHEEDRILYEDTQTNTTYEIRKYSYEEYTEEGYFPEYAVATINEFKKAVEVIKQAKVYMDRIDYLLAGDDSERDFHKRLKEELSEIK